MSEKNKTDLSSIVTVIVVGGMIWFFFGGGMDNTVEKNLDKISHQVAKESVQQYEIAKRNGTPIDSCVQAGMVSAAYLQAKDEPNYKRWKKVESEDCELARIRR